MVAGVKYWEDCSVSIWVEGHMEEGEGRGNKSNRSDLTQKSEFELFLNDFSVFV